MTNSTEISPAELLAALERASGADSAALDALALDARGEWDRAHQRVAAVEDRDACWVTPISTARTATSATPPIGIAALGASPRPPRSKRNGARSPRRCSPAAEAPQTAQPSGSCQNPA